MNCKIIFGRTITSEKFLLGETCAVACIRLSIIVRNDETQEQSKKALGFRRPREAALIPA